MREILFRGKVNDTKEWLMGDLISHTYEKPNIRPIGTLSSYIVIPETVGQYTGLTDKNGKKIFEGDILTSTWNGKYVVEWDERFGEWNFCEQNTSIEFGYGDFPQDEKLEIIGNIHDNPELLKGE